MVRLISAPIPDQASRGKNTVYRMLKTRHARLTLSVLALAALAGCTRQDAGTSRHADGKGAGSTKAEGIDRTILPIAEPAVASITEVDAHKATPPPRFEVKAPAGAPNVVIVLIDDIGFGQAGAFGGP